jgi:Domain of unknown function (DUF4743)
MLQRIRAVNQYAKEIQQTAIPFCVNGIYLGLVRPAMADRLHDTGVFCKTTTTDHQKNHEGSKMILTLNEDIAGTTCESRTNAVASVTKQLRADGIVTGWRDELYPIQERFDDDSPLFLMERAAVTILGALEYGVHINGLVKGSDDDGGTVQMWLARRSATKSEYPGYLVRSGLVGRFLFSSIALTFVLPLLHYLGSHRRGRPTPRHITVRQCHQGMSRRGGHSCGFGDGAACLAGRRGHKLPTVHSQGRYYCTFIVYLSVETLYDLHDSSSQASKRHISQSDDATSDTVTGGALQLRPVPAARLRTHRSGRGSPRVSTVRYGTDSRHHGDEL